MTSSRALVAVRYGLLALVLLGVAWALGRNWDDVSRELGQMSWASVCLSLILTAAAPVCTLLGWRALLGDLGSDLPIPQAASVFFVGQLGKYVPGSVWTVVAQAEMGARLRVPRHRMAVAGLLSIGFGVLCGSLLGIVAFPRLLADGDFGGTAWLLAAATVLGAVLLWPFLLNRIIDLGLRLLRHGSLEHALSARSVLITVAASLSAWLFAGLGIAVLVEPLQANASRTDLLVGAVCGFALASTAGQISVLVPAGVGVRDGILALLLTSFMTVSAATAVVVVARFVGILADVVVAGGGWAWGRRHHLLGSP